MFCFTSFGVKIDHSINIGRAPYTFRINGQNYHRIRSLLAKEGIQPKFAQLYFFDTQNEVKNRTASFIDKETTEHVDEQIVRSLIKMFDEYSSVAKAFRMTRYWCDTYNSVNFHLRLHSDRKTTRQYNTPIVSEVAAIIINDFGDGLPIRDIVVNSKDAGPKRVTRGDTSAAELGKRVVLPRTFTGSPRYMMHNYQNTMALCRSYGNPDLFIMFTSNPKWPEIAKMLAYFPGQKSHDQTEVGTHVMQLSFHLPNQNAITLRDSENLPILLQREGIDVIMFIDWFELNKHDPAARTLTYADIPKHYLWHDQTKLWKPKKQRKCIGRIFYSSPASGERYYLRMLLNVVRGITDFEKLITVNNRLCATFKEACFAYGLLNDDREWTHAISEASLWALGPQLRDIFITILLFCDVARPLELLEANWSLTDFKDLPQPNPNLLTNMDNHLIREALDFDIKKSNAEHQQLHSMLNPE
ncbi:DNA helicase PIF1, ATP-dependent [Tanacetum coccineum]